MISDDLLRIINDAVIAARDAGDLPPFDAFPTIGIETPRNKQHGDFSSNVALTLKKMTGLENSREIAQRILQHIPTQSGLVDRVEIAGPGFLNFYLKPTWLQDMLVPIEAQNTRYGTNTSRTGEKILIEFVSANPTGPISVVNGRAAALGDVLATLLASQGCTVSREFYINDALNSLQMEKFAESVRVRYLQLFGHPVQFAPATDEETGVMEAGLPETDPAREVLHFPKDGYVGEYVRDIALGVKEEEGDRYLNASEEERAAFFREATLQKMVARQRGDLEAFGLVFDTWFYESSLYNSGAVETTIRTLGERGATYMKDNALWLRTSEFGDEKDRVLVRSNEKATYVAADAAYHNDKFLRGFNHLINIWGADHHGYVARLKAGVAALGHDVSHLEIILTQMVSLVRDGEAVIGGKRKGVVIELKEDLIEEIGKDAARFYFLLNSYETPATVDIELAKKQSNDNPVYYVQYAHARLCSILAKAAEQGISLLPAEKADRSLLTQPSELDVLRKLFDYPTEITAASRDYAPHRLPRYAMELASLLNVFYENCRVLSGKEETIAPELTTARLALVNGARIVLHNLLSLLGISAPEKM